MIVVAITVIIDGRWDFVLAKILTMKLERRYNVYADSAFSGGFSLVGLVDDEYSTKYE